MLANHPTHFSLIAQAVTVLLWTVGPAAQPQEEGSASGLDSSNMHGAGAGDALKQELLALEQQWKELEMNLPGLTAALSEADLANGQAGVQVWYFQVSMQSVLAA